MKTVTIFSSSNRTAATYNSEDFSAEGYVGARFFLNVGTETGTSTIDVKVQVKDQLSGTYFDLTGASFVQVTADTGDQILTVFPGITAAANVAVSNVIGGVFRLVAVVGGTAFTFSVSAELWGQ